MAAKKIELDARCRAIRWSRAITIFIQIIEYLPGDVCPRLDGVICCDPGHTQDGSSGDVGEILFGKKSVIVQRTR